MFKGGKKSLITQKVQVASERKSNCKKVLCEEKSLKVIHCANAVSF